MKSIKIQRTDLFAFLKMPVAVVHFQLKSRRMKKYIVLLFIAFLGSTITYAQVDRSHAPQPGPAPKIEIGNYTKFEMPNGLKVFVVENHRLPRVSYSLSLIASPDTEGEHAGISSIASDLIGTGTKTRTKDQINEDIDFIAGDLSASPGGIYGSSLKKHTEKLLDVFSDVTMNSLFSKEELEKSRTQMLSNLAASKDDPSYIAGNVSSALIYGKNHPYGEFETEETVKSITLDMCTKYYQKFFHPNVCYLTVVGDITPNEAKKLVEKYLGKWAKADVPMQTYAKPVAPQKDRVVLVDRPESVQSVINVCYPVDLGLGSSDYFKARVMNTILGGGVFRLFTNLREKHAYTYGAYSSFSINPLASSFKASTSVRNAVTDSSVYQILYEMKRIRTEPVGTKELDMAKNYMMGNFALSLEKPQTIASFAVNTERYNLPKDYYTNYLKNIEAVNSQDIQAAAAKYILPDKSDILVVGKASEIADKLKEFSADGKIEYYDSEANPVDLSKMKKPLPEGLTVGKVLADYIKNSGGIENIEKIKDLTMKASFTVQGMKLNMNMIYKIPGKFLTDVFMNGQSVQKQIVNGDKGFQSGMQGSKKIEGDELEQLKMQAELFPELKYEAAGYKPELKEIANVDGKDAYVVDVTSPSGNVSTDYYSVETGLKIRSSSTMDSPMGKVTQTSDILEYTEVGGVKLPKKIKQTAGPQSFDISVDSIEINTGVQDDVFKIE